MLKTRNLNAQFAYAVSRNEMTEDTRHNGGSSGASIRTRVPGDHISNTQAGVCFYFSSRAKPRWQLLAADNSAHSSDTELLIVFLSKVLVPPCARSLTADVNVRPDNDSPGIAE